MSTENKSLPERTRWFSINKDGQPVRAGWYETLYKGDKVLYPEMMYWCGEFWRWEPNSSPLTYGNQDTAGERWRGLTAPVKF
jgi:hypothetical protein